MKRIDGFIDVDSMLQEIGIDTITLNSILESPLINIIKDNTNGIHFSFEYGGETYFYKYSSYVKNGSKITISPYNELVAEELSKDFGIPCISYDLATIGFNKGVLSKNYKKENTNYIEGKIILSQFSNYPENILENIWDALEYHYQGNPYKREIIDYLMTKIVNIYLFDIISCQCDRHARNWQIMESNNNIDIAPLYDNDRILISTGEKATVGLGIHFIKWMNYENLWDSIQKFQNVSSEEFRKLIKEKLWMISDENLHSVFARIENKTGCPMPEERKNFYLSNYQEHKRRLEKVLGLTVEREEHNERKNR